MIKTHESVQEAIKARYVIRHITGHFEVPNQYWRWCDENTKPFVAISISSPRSKYALVELDLFRMTEEGFNADAGYEILHYILGQHLRPRSTFRVGTEFVNAWVDVQAAVPLALFLYQSAIDEGVCLTSEKYIKAVMDRAATGKIPKCAFQPFSAEVYPVVLKE